MEKKTLMNRLSLNKEERKKQSTYGCYGIGKGVEMDFFSQVIL